MKRCALVVVVLFTLSTLSGCANIKDDSTRTKTEGTLIGGSIGAVIGGAIGYAVGGKKGLLVGAAAGAAAGGGAGFAYGNHVAGQKAQYAKEEEWLDACITQARAANQEIVTFNQNLTKEIEKIQQETVALKKKKKNAKTRQAKLQARQNEVDSMLAATNKKLELARNELGAQQHAVEEAKKSEQSDFAVTLDGEVENLKTNIAELEKRTKDLASLSASMSV